MTDLQKIINSKIEKVLKGMVAETQEEFNNAAYSGDNDVSVKYEMTEKGGKLIAEGKSVMFIEYGTGVSYPDHPSGKYQHGTYGEKRGANPKGWFYYGEPGNLGEVPLRKDLAEKGLIHTYGNPAACIMFNAVDKIKERLKNE